MLVVVVYETSKKEQSGKDVRMGVHASGYGLLNNYVCNNNHCVNLFKAIAGFFVGLMAKCYK